MDITERIKVVSKLQKTSADVFKAIPPSLRIGMTELEIAKLAKQEFDKRGIKEFWYNVAFVVLIGVERFQIGTTTLDYAIKSPSKDVYLEDGMPVHMDFSPMDPKTKIWGDWASTIVFHPRDGIDNEQVAFLDEMRNIQRSIIAQITYKTTGAEIASYYLNIFAEKGISLLDVRNNVGHSIHEGSKDSTQRVWLDQNNTKPLGEGIFTLEPGGIRQKKDGNGIVVGRFEECIYIPKLGNAILLGNKELVALTI